jgi:hypothetical protein
VRSNHLSYKPAHEQVAATARTLYRIVCGAIRRNQSKIQNPQSKIRGFRRDPSESRAAHGFVSPRHFHSLRHLQFVNDGLFQVPTWTLPGFATAACAEIRLNRLEAHP